MFLGPISKKRGHYRSHSTWKTSFFLAEITKTNYQLSETFYFIKISYVLTKLWIFFYLEWCFLSKRCHFQLKQQRNWDIKLESHRRLDKTMYSKRSVKVCDLHQLWVVFWILHVTKMAHGLYYMYCKIWCKLQLSHVYKHHYTAYIALEQVDAHYTKCLVHFSMDRMVEMIILDQ